jgi:pimeloyl-ACP methyl ester carboxylesterase
LDDRFFIRRGLRLHVVDHGGRGLPVVLLHGGSAHARWWDFVVPHLGPELHALALDLRGHGDSEWATDGAYRLTDYANDVAKMIEELSLDRPALVGHSLGSFVALRYAVDHPRDLSALVMIDGRASFDSSGSRYMRLLGMLSPARYTALDQAVARFRLLPKETIATPDVFRHVARMSFRESAGRWTTKFDRASLAGHEPFDLENRLAELEFPVLFVRGELSPVVSAATLERLAAACREAQVAEIAGCHHHVPIDRPDLLGREIRSFLQRFSGRPGNA